MLPKLVWYLSLVREKTLYRLFVSLVKLQLRKANDFDCCWRDHNAFFDLEMLQQVPVQLTFDPATSLSIDHEAQGYFDPVVGHGHINRELDLYLLQRVVIDHPAQLGLCIGLQFFSVHLPVLQNDLGCTAASPLIWVSDIIASIRHESTLWGYHNEQIQDINPGR